MENFKPTDEQLIDFYCGDLDDDILQSRIEAFLKTHPEAANEVKDWNHLENAYAKLHIDGPSQLALANVRQNALNEIQNQKSSWSFLQSTTTLKRLTLSFSILFLAGATFALTRLWIPVQTGFQADVAQNDATVQTSHLASTTNANTATTAPALDPELESWASTEFKAAVLSYQQEQFDAANQKFASIITRYPSFSENKKLYTYWIESLKKLGQYDLATEKKAELDKIP